MKELVAVGVLAVAAMIGDHSPNQRPSLMSGCSSRPQATESIVVLDAVIPPEAQIREPRTLRSKKIT